MNNKAYAHRLLAETYSNLISQGVNPLFAFARAIDTVRLAALDHLIDEDLKTFSVQGAAAWYACVLTIAQGDWVCEYHTWLDQVDCSLPYPTDYMAVFDAAACAWDGRDDRAWYIHH